MILCEPDRELLERTEQEEADRVTALLLAGLNTSPGTTPTAVSSQDIPEHIIPEKHHGEPEKQQGEPEKHHFY